MGWQNQEERESREGEGVWASLVAAGWLGEELISWAMRMLEVLMDVSEMSS